MIPLLHSRFLAYGSRAVSPRTSEAQANQNGQRNGHQQPGSTGYDQQLIAFLDFLAEFRVPHSWFTSFYVVSVVSSAFWASQIVTKGPAFGRVAQQLIGQPSSTTVTQVAVAWAMLFVQGNRRLYESLALSKPSTAKMWIGHWALGIFFYLGMGCAVWVEGIRKYII